MTAMTGADRERLDAAREVIHGEHPDASNSNALYAVYVAVIGAGVYGVPAAHELVRLVNPAWLARHISSALGIGILAAAALAVLVLGFVVGKVRGPVVPTLPYLDLVLTSPIDRAVALGRWWRFSLVGAVVGGVILGLVVGAGLAIAQVAGPLVLLVTAAAGAGLGALGAGTWLWGQVRTWPRRSGEPATFLRVGTSLRQLHITSLREQASSAITMGGALLAGDLRMLRLDVASRTARTPHARTVRLRPSGPVGVIVRRDLLGLRRAPGPTLAGTVVSAAGVAALMRTVDTPDAPSLLALGSALVGYLGFGFWTEGLRIQGDNAGTAALLGIDFRTEALAHLVVPSLLHALASVVIGVVLVTTSGVQVAAVAWVLVTGAVLAGGHLIAGFRGLPPMAAYRPGGGVLLMVGWYLYPVIVASIAVTVTTVVAARSQLAGQSFVLLLAAALGVVRWGLHRVRALGEAHRL